MPTLISTKKKHMDLASYITGFTDGEGCFSVSFNFREKLRTKIELRPSFSIGQNRLSLQVLEDIRAYFGCGSIRFSKRDRIYKYETRNIDEIVDKIIPHFEKFPLMTSKKDDFELFKKICKGVSQSKHLNPSHLKDMINLAYLMNRSGKRKYEKAELLSVLDKVKI